MNQNRLRRSQVCFLRWKIKNFFTSWKAESICARKSPRRSPFFVKRSKQLLSLEREVSSVDLPTMGHTTPFLHLLRDEGDYHNQLFHHIHQPFVVNFISLTRKGVSHGKGGGVGGEDYRFMLSL
mmetsp:Transcript_2320/g.3328  ORF Transcript_2320/g.3328 Transcript_2320/m.3328 type:complete len:124 (+) Transcript_2320:1803-2174(+)